MNNYISCFSSHYLVEYIYVDICSKFQINSLRIVRDIYARIFLIFGDTLTNYLTLAGSRGSFDPNNKVNKQ